METIKKTVAILFGGKSPEHKISLLSARSVVDNLDNTLFDKVLIGIDKKGEWRYYGSNIRFINEGNPTEVSLPEGGESILFSQDHGDHRLYSKEDGKSIITIDIVFPVLHGLHGEDGAIQGLMKLAGIPCVGCDILGSAICIDKDVAKRLLRDGGVRIADFITLRKGFNDTLSYKEISARLGNELYIKPVSLGSSVGVSFIDNEVDYKKAVVNAFNYDPKVLIEEKIVGREIECSIIGNENPRASTIGEINPTSEFYTFESKYVDKEDAKLSIPANISEEATERARSLAIQSYRLLECKGYSRVDMFLTDGNELILNEVNTIPGFTNISMYPKLWEYCGIPYKELLTTLIQLSIDNYKACEKIKS